MADGQSKGAGRQVGSTSKFPLVGSRISDQKALIILLRRLSIARSIQEISEIVTQGARALLDAGGITFVLRDGDRCFYMEEDALSPLWKGRRFPMSACISGWSMTNGKAAAIRDIREDPRIPQDAYRPTFVRSLVMVPVRQDDPIAAMGAYWPEVRDIPEEQIELLQAIANAAALAMGSVQGRQAEEHDEEQQERLAQREQIIASEFSHRTKNLVALIESMAVRTAATAGSVEQFQNTFLGRLRAIAAGHMRGFGGGSERIELREFIAEVAESCGVTLRRIHMHGEPVVLGTRHVRALNLTLHELFTNAVKHGALSAQGGSVSIGWSLADDAGTRSVRLSWRESGGPRVETPALTGFGMELINNLCPFELDGDVEVRFAPTGLRCELSFSLS